MPLAITVFVLSFMGALVLPFSEVANTPFRTIPSIVVLGIINLWAAYQIMRLHASKS
jgi:hypothetical protein